MTSIGLLVLALLAPSSQSEPAGLQITGVTPTQAILRYTAPDASACTLEVSESPSFTPLVHDVDPALYAGADRDDRPGNIASGRERVFVIGKRIAARAADGRMYSRALQAYTCHYLRLRCGQQTATAEFQTENLAAGNTAPEPYPADPDNPGEYAWPNMNFAAGPNEKHVDPQTGILINRLTGPQSYVHDDYTNVPPLAVFDRSGGRNPWQFREGTRGATYIADGTAPAKLYVPLDASSLKAAFPPRGSGEIVQLDWVTVKIAGSTTAKGDDGRLAGCLTTSGVACVDGSRALELDMQSCGAGCTLGDTRSELAAWSAGSVPPFSGPDLGTRKTVASYDPATGALAWSSGDLFNPNLAAGSNLWIENVPYRVRSVSGPRSVAIDAGLRLNSPVTAITSAFGVLLWKKTGTRGTSVRLDELSFNFGAPYAFTAWDQSSANHCHPALVQYAGEDGYHCVLLGGSGSVLAWINRATGDANMLGSLTVAAGKDRDGNAWGASPIGFASALFDADDANAMYGVIKDRDGKDIVVRMAYSGDNSPMNGGVGFYSAPWSEVRNLTPSKPNGYDLESLIQRFDSRYDPARFTCNGHLMQAGKLIVSCNVGQDYAPGGWVVVFDPKIVPGPSSNPVVAAVPTNGAKAPNPTPLRWCVLHSLSSGDPGWILVGSNPAGSGATFTTSLAQPVGASDTRLSVSGEPGGGLIDIARVGDFFRLDQETVRITAKVSANLWTVERGQGGSTPAAHAAGAGAVARCSAWEGQKAYSAWWHYAADPHGSNASGKTVDSDTPYFGTGHGVFNLGTFTLVAESPECVRNAGNGVCIVSRTGPLQTSIHQPPTSFVKMLTSFAGITSGAYAFASHASRAQMAASDFEKQWVLDSHPILSGSFLDAPVSKVAGAGQLYAMTRTLNPKRVATYAFCGSHPLVDVSGPGSRIGDGQEDAYTYCVPNAPGECRPDAAPGKVYFNCPNRTQANCSGGQYDASGQNVEDACIFDGTLIAGAQVLQRGTNVTDRLGAYTRRITHGFARYRRQEETYHSNGKALPGGEWALFLGRWIDGQRSDIYAAKLPPFQVPDGVNRSTFVPLKVEIDPAPGRTYGTVLEFGYDPQFRCGSRREACVAASATVDETAPFYWASERYRGVSCATGCTIAIPAISQRVVYYRVKHRGADGSVLAVGKTGVLASN